MLLARRLGGEYYFLANIQLSKTPYGEHLKWGLYTK